MEGLKKFANKKSFTILLLIHSLLGLYISWTSYSNLREYFERATSCILVPGLIIAVGLAVIVYCLFNNRKDIVLLGGAVIVTIGYAVRTVTNEDWMSGIHILLWWAICLLILIIISSDRISLLNKIKNNSITIAKVVAIIFVLMQICFVISQNYYSYGGFNVKGIFITIFVGITSTAVTVFSYSAFTIYLGLTAYGVEDLDIQPELNAPNGYGGVNISATGVTGGKMKMSLVLHIILLIISCGVWYMIWIQKVTDYVDSESEKKRMPVIQLLLCLIVPFYFIYWVYKSAQLIDAMYEARGQHSDSTTLCLVLAIFTGVIATIVIQHKINGLEDLKVANVSVDTVENAE